MFFLKKDLDQRRKMILEGSIVETIFFLTIPTFMMAIVQYLIPFSDGLYLNRELGTDVGAAVGYTQPAISILLAASQGLGVVAMSMVGQLNGRGDTEKAKSVSLQILVFGFLLGILLMPLCWIMSPFLAKKAGSEIFTYVLIYFNLNAMVIPFQFMASIFNSIKNATGEPEAPFYRMVVLLLLKLLFNRLFLINLNWGIFGAVFASFSAYVITAIWM